MLLILSILGLADSLFLTYEHYMLLFVGCPVNSWVNCLAVTTSKYSEVFGIPLSIFGSVYYLFLIFFILKNGKIYKYLFLLTSSFGVLFSIYLIYIQAFAIGIFCIYCLASALISFLIFGLSFNPVDFVGAVYKFLVKPILFLINPEMVHENMVRFGERLPPPVNLVFKKIFYKKYPNLEQKLLGINFKTPVGLAAGFDYEARLTQILPNLGFGFETVGTITNIPYRGNPGPMLGRLPKSKSLMVNKGFKSLGVEGTLKNISGENFSFPIGISIGRSNSEKLDTLEKSIEDIVISFETLKKSKVKNSYYELNISCPNIIHDLGIDFYKTKNLEDLLSAVDKIGLTKPVLIKMPIDQTDSHTINMLKVIASHKVAGVIFGNLQTNRSHKSLDKKEVMKFKMGKFSGKPTFEDSNRLINLTYKNYKNRFIIVGTGGVFDAEDAWVKFVSGASLVQLITGMIFEGPQLIAQINRDLSKKLTGLGYKSISQIVGTAV